MNKKTMVVIIVGLFIVFFIALSIKFSGNDDGELNDYENIEVVEEIEVNNGSINGTIQEFGNITNDMSKLITVFMAVSIGAVILGMVFNLFNRGCY